METQRFSALTIPRHTQSSQVVSCSAIMSILSWTPPEHITRRLICQFLPSEEFIHHAIFLFAVHLHATVTWFLEATGCHSVGQWLGVTFSDSLPATLLKTCQTCTVGLHKVCNLWCSLFRSKTDMLEDAFLPFSLLHKKLEQYRFSGEPQSSTADDSNYDPELVNYHKQAYLDITCSRIISPARLGVGDNVTQSEVHEHMKQSEVHNEDSLSEAQGPIYNEKLMFDLVKLGVSENHWLFYSKVISEHSICPTVTTADGVRAALLQHLFSGDCLSHLGVQCIDVVRNEMWPQSMGVKLIDLVCKWADEDTISTRDLSYICNALEPMPSMTGRRLSLMRMLARQRRHLLRSLDVATLPLKDTLQNLGSSSSLETVRAMCAAHKVPTQNEKVDLVEDLMGHFTQGDCAENSSPGCSSITKEVSSSMGVDVCTQVSVLQHMKSLLSSRQLRRVLDLHGISYDEDDSKKKLKQRLTWYVRSLEKGKFKETEAKREEDEHLQKLQEIRKNWPKLVPPQLKETLIKNFQNATSSVALASFTCACCARELPVRDRQRKSHTEVDINILSGPTHHLADKEMAAPPTPFSTGPLANILLDRNGVECVNEDKFYLNLCTICLRSLQRKCLPKHALANRLHLGPIPHELSELTMVEECLIARARAKSWIVKLQETEGGTSSPVTQRGLKGHTIIYPQQPGELATVLPPPMNEMLTFICIVFVGSSTLTKDWLRTKAKPLVVRREKVYNALLWLKEHNPLYKDVNLSIDNLQSLPEEDVLPYHVENLAADGAQETLVSRYDNMAESQDSTAQNHFESVVITDVNAHTPLSQLTAAAVRHMRTKGLPYVQSRHGPKPLNEFFNVELFPMLYPVLFPYGCGGFEDGERSKPISLKEHVKYLFSLKDRHFQTHGSFLFTVFNILQRRALLLHASLKVKKNYFSRFAKEFSSVSSEGIGAILEQLERGERVVAKTIEEKRVLTLMKEVNLVTSKVPGSSAACVAMRNEIRALTLTHRMPSFYITINPADTHNPVVKFLAGAEIDIDKMLEHEIPNFWEQSLLVSSNPTVGAKFFNVYLKAFLKTVLGYSEDEVNVEGGILGTVKAHYGCVEAQGRGSLHCHMLVWIEGALNPNEIREKVMADLNWGQRLLALSS
jgi:hypothetical protein